MKNRHGFVSNSSSCNFFIKHGDIDKYQIAEFMDIIAGYLSYCKPEDSDSDKYKDTFQFSRAQLDENQSLFVIFKAWTWLRDNNIPFEAGGDGLPGGWDTPQEEGYKLLLDECLKWFSITFGEFGDEPSDIREDSEIQKEFIDFLKCIKYGNEPYSKRTEVEQKWFVARLRMNEYGFTKAMFFNYFNMDIWEFYGTVKKYLEDNFSKEDLTKYLNMTCKIYEIKDEKEKDTMSRISSIVHDNDCEKGFVKMCVDENPVFQEFYKKVLKIK